jgi:hypothetical protein
MFLGKKYIEENLRTVSHLLKGFLFFRIHEKGRMAKVDLNFRLEIFFSHLYY